MPIYNHSPIVFPDVPTGQVLSDDGTWIEQAEGGTPSWGSILGSLADQLDLQDVLDGKVEDNDARLSDARQPLTHYHVVDDTSGLQTALDGKSSVGHGHAVSDTTGLQIALDGKEPANANIQTHVISAHAPSNAQKNSDITKAEIEAQLTGVIASHSHAGGGSPTGVFNDMQMSILQSDGTLNAALGVQTWCGTNKTGQDVFTLEANTTYLVRGMWIVNTGATTHTTAMAWALSGATVTYFEYQVLLWGAAANAVATAQSTVHVSGVASKVLNATSTTVYTNIQFNGLLVTANAGTVTPQINFSANPTGTNLMKRGSWVSFSKLGANTVTVLGGWA